MNVLTIPQEKMDFDWEIYRSLYPDLSVIRDTSDGYAHWLETGIQEGRVASFQGIINKFWNHSNPFPEDFDWLTYLSLNPDLQGNISNKWQAIVHYSQHGVNENRCYCHNTNDAIGDFDWEFYVWYNQDFREIISNEAEAWNHWLTSGKANNRLASPKQFYENQGVNIDVLPPDFNIQEYIKLYPKLSEEGIVSKWHIISHFLRKSNDERKIYSFEAWGKQLEEKGEHQKAIEAFEQAMMFHPSDLDIRIYLIRVLLHCGRWKRVIAIYRNTVESEKLNLGGYQICDFSHRVIQVFQQCLEASLEESRQLAVQHLGLLDGYSQAIETTDIVSHHKAYDIFREDLNTNLDEQIELSSRIYSLNTTWKKISNSFNTSFRVADFITFQSYESPIVSIIIPVYNKIDYTVRCLSSLCKNISQSLQFEVIIVNDFSTDETKEYLEAVEGLVLVNNSNNLGFIDSCNAGATAAKGEFLYFLNNDTEVLPGAIESLVEVFRTYPNAGAVGSKLIYPSGALQEAGGIIWGDASGWNYGRNENPLDPKYNFLRSVDYCSGASLLVKTETFNALGGFERDFAPAYYEDTDLCFAIRETLGLDVFCQPKSEIIHYEGVSSGTSTSSGVKRYQVINAEKFKQKWAKKLLAHPINKKGYEDAHRAARRFQGAKTILVIDSYLPYYDKESGSRRLFQLLKIFKELNYHVIYLPNDMEATEPYLSELQNMQMEVLYTCDGYGTLPEEQLRERLPLIDIAWVCRPDLMKRYIEIIRGKPGIKVIYDTIDLHYLRLKREVELGLSSLDVATATKGWMDMQSLELYMARKADLTITVTEPEQKLLQEQGIESVEVIPNIHVPYEGEIPGFEDRSGILFIGGYNHPPNVDAVEWLCQEIMPLVWQEIPDMKVTLLGSNPSERVKKLANDKVAVPGYVRDVSPYFLSHRIFVAPLRYGAGMKGKIGQALEYCLPIVSTTIGVEGMALISGRNVLEANTKADFFQAVIKLYTDQVLWANVTNSLKNIIQVYSPKYIREKLINLG
ncbi:MAG: glycosyltransferase [Leptolyngbyaceae bacterium]|nr:glycosyltransferase [Leptolyngbyaceae bacterium]